MTEAEAEVVRRSFARRQLGVLLIMALALAGFVVSISIDKWTLVATLVFIGLGIAVLVGSFLVWRCPRCGASFGRDLLVTQCPHCFAQLTKP